MPAIGNFISTISRRGGGSPYDIKNFAVELLNPDGVDYQNVSITWTPTEFETEIYVSVNEGSFTLLTVEEPWVGSFIDVRMNGEEQSLQYYARSKDNSDGAYVWSAEAKAVDTKIRALNSYMPYARRLVLDAYIKAQKTSGIWTLTYADWWLLEGTIKGRINIKSPDDYYLADIGTGALLTWVTDDSVYGATAVSRGLNTGFNPTTVGIGQNDFAVHWYCKPSTNSGNLFGINVGHNIYAQAGLYCINGGLKAATVDHTESGCVERSASNRIDLYRNGTSYSNNNGASALANLDIYICCSNNGGTVSSPSQAKLSHIAFTKKMTAQQHLDWVANESAYLAGL